jgi:hypothetical protein
MAVERRANGEGGDFALQLWERLFGLPQENTTNGIAKLLVVVVDDNASLCQDQRQAEPVEGCRRRRESDM